MSVVEFGHFGQTQLMRLARRPGGNNLRKERPEVFQPFDSKTQGPVPKLAFPSQAAV